MSTLLIVDDNAAVRKNVRSILSKHSAVEITGEAHDGEDALDKIQGLRPDIVLLDVDMPRMNGIEAAREIRRLSPSTQVVFFSIHPSSLFNKSWIQSQGFVSKLEIESQLIPTLDRLMQNMPKGLSGPICYQWQHSVIQAFACNPEAAEAKIETAEHVIAMRLTDILKPDRDERSALSQALQALRELRVQMNLDLDVGK